MTNREKLEKAIKHFYGSDYQIGICDKEIEVLSKSQLVRLIDKIEYYLDTNIIVKISGREYVIEVSNVDNEVDFMILSKSDFTKKYN